MFHLKTEKCIGDKNIDFTNSTDGQSHSIASPGYPGVYSNGVNCLWKVTAGKGRVLVIFINEIDLTKETDVLVIGKV